MSQQISIFTLASFNQQNFNAALKKEWKDANITSVEYEQMFPYLLNLNPNSEKKDICICWISLRDVFQAMAMKLDLAELVLKLKDSFKHAIIILPTIDSPSFNMFQGQELRNLLYKINLTLAEKSIGTNVAVLDPTSWLVKHGANAISSQLWYLSKTPLHKNVFISAADACKSTINAFTGRSKKVLIVDLDDTLWGGIVGDDGIENLKIGGHDGIGEAFADFQMWIQRIKSWGVVLCICSKNDESIALEVFDKHSGMILKKSDFIKWKINWDDKAKNIAELVKELNVGMDSVVFLDDNPAERARVRNALPGILVPDMPDDKMEYPAFIRSLNCFNSTHISEEDQKRSELYKDEQTRSDARVSFVSVDEWIKSLNIELNFEELNDLNLNRAEQLLNKTNQMNLRTRRLSKEELKNWSSQKDHWSYVVSVKDIFGDSGITGLLGFHITAEGNIFLDDFLMSCRVMGRKIEDQMLNFVIEKSKYFGSVKIVGEYLPTEKNKPVKDFFKEKKDIIFNSTF